MGEPGPRVEGQGPDLRHRGAAGGSEETSSGALPLGLWKDSELLDESFCPLLCFGECLPTVPPDLGDWCLAPF